jgi:hypothetical protein
LESVVRIVASTVLGNHGAAGETARASDTLEEYSTHQPVVARTPGATLAVLAGPGSGAVDDPHLW